MKILALFVGFYKKNPINTGEQPPLFTGVAKQKGLLRISKIPKFDTPHQSAQNLIFERFRANGTAKIFRPSADFFCCGTRGEVVAWNRTDIKQKGQVRLERQNEFALKGLASE